MPYPTRRDFVKQASLVAGTGLLGAAAGPARAQATRQPNILLLFPDQHRWDWTPLHDVAPVQMPNYKRLAARGTAFERAHVASPVCAPSRSCLATGREYERCGVASN